MLNREGTEARPCANRGATRLASVLDRANFSPGALNDIENLHQGACALSSVRGEQPPATSQADTAPDISGLDLAALVLPSFLHGDRRRSPKYRTVPSAIAAQAKLKFLPYRSAAEALAKNFTATFIFWNN